MSTLPEIQREIESLSFEDRQRLMAWFQDQVDVEELLAAAEAGRASIESAGVHRADRLREDVRKWASG